MTPIFLIVFGAGMVFVILALLIKKPADVADAQTSPKLQTCAICQEKFPESDLVTRTVGDANYRRYFCDRCVTELYEESRLLHDPRYKASSADAR